MMVSVRECFKETQELDRHADLYAYRNSLSRVVMSTANQLLDTKIGQTFWDIDLKFEAVS